MSAIDKLRALAESDERPDVPVRDRLTYGDLLDLLDDYEELERAADRLEFDEAAARRVREERDELRRRESELRRRLERIGVMACNALCWTTSREAAVGQAERAVIKLVNALNSALEKGGGEEGLRIGFKARDRAIAAEIERDKAVEQAKTLEAQLAEALESRLELDVREELDALRARVSSIDGEVRALRVERDSLLESSARLREKVANAERRQRAHVEELEAERDELRAAAAREERLDEQTLEERDRREDQLEAVAAALGCREEWSSVHDHGDCALRAARELRARVEKLEGLERLAGMDPRALFVACGKESLGDRTQAKAGCGREVCWWLAFRCVECGRWFHRDCARRHFREHDGEASADGARIADLAREATCPGCRAALKGERVDRG